MMPLSLDERFKLLREFLEKPEHQKKLSFNPEAKTGQQKVTSFGVLYSNKRLAKVFSWICLNPLNYGVQGVTLEGACGIAIFHEARLLKKQNLEFLRWITSPTESPWRQLINLQPYQDFKSIFKFGYALPNVGVPSNWIVNFLTAFRWSFERPQQCKLWLDLISKSVSKESAFLIANSVGPFKRIPDTWYPWSIGLHSSVDINHMGLKSLAALRTGTPNKEKFTKHLFSQDTHNLPVNCVWYFEKDSLYKPFKKIFKREHTTTSSFGDSFVECYALFDDLVNLGKEWDAALKERE